MCLSARIPHPQVARFGRRPIFCSGRSEKLKNLRIAASYLSISAAYLGRIEPPALYHLLSSPNCKAYCGRWMVAIPYRDARSVNDPATWVDLLTFTRGVTATMTDSS